MANKLRSAAIVVIDDELESATAAMEQLRLVCDQNRSSRTISNPTATLATLPAPRLSRVPLDQVGACWQRRLRVTSIARIVVPLLIAPASQTHDRVLQSELQLLTRAPWQHGDRLLSAYETAHGEIREYLREAVDLAVQPAAADDDSIILGLP